MFRIRKIKKKKKKSKQKWQFSIWTLISLRKAILRKAKLYKIRTDKEFARIYFFSFFVLFGFFFFFFFFFFWKPKNLCHLYLSGFREHEKIRFFPPLGLMWNGRKLDLKLGVLSFSKVCFVSVPWNYIG